MRNRLRCVTLFVTEEPFVEAAIALVRHAEVTPERGKYLSEKVVEEPVQRENFAPAIPHRDLLGVCNRDSLEDQRACDDLAGLGRGEEADLPGEPSGEQTHLSLRMDRLNTMACRERRSQERPELVDRAALSDLEPTCRRPRDGTSSLLRIGRPRAWRHRARDLARNKSSAGCMEGVDVLLGRSDVIDVRHRLVYELPDAIAPERVRNRLESGRNSATTPSRS